ncbi:unnamed protein product, partial [Porites lobata]
QIRCPRLDQDLSSLDLVRDNLQYYQMPQNVSRLHEQPKFSYSLSSVLSLYKSSKAKRLKIMIIMWSVFLNSQDSAVCTVGNSAGN